MAINARGMSHKKTFPTTSEQARESEREKLNLTQVASWPDFRFAIFSFIEIFSLIFNEKLGMQHMDERREKMRRMK